MEKNLDVDRLHLIDVSSEDDCLISSSDSGFLGNQNDYFELSERERERVQENEVILPQPSQPENTRKTGKCNLRKSLAWDSAFFTSAGVLEPDELSIINCGLKKPDAHTMPRIQEETRRSAESVCTLDSDNLESLEVGLFEDIRASIQRSTQPCPSTPAGPASSKMDSASQGKMLPTDASKRQPEKIKDAEQIKKGTKMEATVRPRATQAAARSGELTVASLRPPKIAGRINPVSTSPTKRTFLGANRVKIEVNTVKSTLGRRETIGGLKRPVSGDSSVTPRSTPSPKSSSSSSVSGTKMDSAASCSSHNRSGSTSSDSTDKSPFTSSRKKINCRNVSLSSASTLKSPLRILSKTKTDTGDSRLSAYLMSIPKASPTISPASSLDDWSSESSSSTSVNYHSNSSLKSLEISSPRKGFYLERGTSQSEAQKHQGDQPYFEQKRVGLPTPFSKKTMLGAGSLTRPTASSLTRPTASSLTRPTASSLTRPAATGSLTRPAATGSLTRAQATSSLTRPAGTEVSRSSKPSGLRMPSPKIGFFDAEKSTEPTRTGSLQFHPGVRSSIPKHGAGVGSFHGGAVKAKPGKILPARSMTGKTSISGDSHLTVSHCTSSTRTTCPAQPREFSNALPKVSATKAIRGSCPGVTSKSEDDEIPVTGSHLKTGELEDMNMKNGKILSSHLNEGEDGCQNAIVDDIVTIREQVSATKTIRDCHGITLKHQNNSLHRTEVQSQIKIGEVEGRANAECEYSSSFVVEGGNGGQDSFVKDIGSRSEKVSTTKATIENQGMTLEHNDLYDVTSSDRHSKIGKLGELEKTEGESLHLKEGENHPHDALVNDIGNISGNSIMEISTKDVPHKETPPIRMGQSLGHLESNLVTCHDSNENCGSESHPRIREVMSSDLHSKIGKLGELEKTVSESLHLKEGENHCHDAVVNDIGNISKKSIMEISSKDVPHNKTPPIGMGQSLGHLESNQVSCHDSNESYGIESHSKIREVRELSKTECESLYLKEFEKYLRDAFVNDIGNLGEMLVIETSTNDVPEISCKPSFDCNCDKQTTSIGTGEKLGHLDSDLVSCHDSNEKENSLCSGNQVDALIRPLSSIDLNIEELTEINGSCLSQLDGKMDGSNDAELLLSSSSMDVLPRTRILSLCNETGSFELASELTTEKVSTHSIREGLQTENK